MGNDTVTLDVYDYYADGGRNGHLSGMIIAPVGLPERMADKGCRICWGEVLGKHSDVVDVLDEHSFTRQNVSRELVDLMLKELLTCHTEWPNVYGVSGYNPFEQLSPEDVDDEEDQ